MVIGYIKGVAIFSLGDINTSKKGILITLTDNYIYILKMMNLLGNSIRYGDKQKTKWMML